MDNLKDLFDITEEDFKKKEESKKNKNIIEEKTKKKEEKEKTEKKQEETLKKKAKNAKKHFKYKNGKVKYMNFLSEGIEGIKNSIKIDSKRKDRSLLLKNIAIIIIIISLVFIFFTVKSSPSTEPNATDEIKQGESVNNDSPAENNEGDDIEYLTKNEIINNIKTYNSKEIEKVKKYLNIKSNRVSTVSDIEKYKKEKENLYVSLVNIKSKMTEEEFAKVEKLIIESIGMSKELLNTFLNNGGNKEIKTILIKYTGEENL